MTIAEAVASFKYRMEDPNGDIWDSDTEIYKILDTAQTIAVTLLVNIKQIERLKELQDNASGTLASGRMGLAAANFFELVAVQRNTDKVFLGITGLPSASPASPMMQEDSLQESAYYWNEYVYIQGGTNGNQYTMFWIDKPTGIVAAVAADGEFSVNEYVQELVLKLAERIGWLIDKQPDRAKAEDLVQEIKLIYGVNL